MWITEDRDLNDIVLLPGQSHIGHGPGSMLIYGFEDANVDIKDAATVAARRLNA